MPDEHCADQQLAEIAAREWKMRRQHIVRELGAYVPLQPVLPAVDPQTQEQKLQFWSNVLADLDAIPAAELSDVGREDLLVLRSHVEGLYLAQLFKDYERPFNAFTSFWDDTAASVREETFDSEQKYRDALSLMQSIPAYFRQNIENMRSGIARGFTQPAVVLPLVIKTIEAVLAQVPEATDYFRPFQNFPSNIPAATQADLRERAVVLIANSVLPAHAELLEFMRSDYVPAAVKPIAATQLPDGERYYAAKVREFTTLNIDPKEISEQGQAEVVACRENMLAAMRDSGFSGGLPEFLQFLKGDRQFYAKSPEELLMRAAWVTKKVEGKLHQFFGLLPRRRFAIEPVPESIAPSYPMGTGAPGLYLLNTYNLGARPLYLLPVLTLHEAVPGHCFQMSLAAENPNRPPFRAETYAIAYGNAWALYCEKRLGVEMSIYETPYELFGMWSLLALRAARMVVDVGVHAKGWSYDQARDYMAANTGLPDSVIVTELVRYISWPGQALGYYLGMMTIERVRARAEQALGADFDIRAFHDRILELGPVPMTVVEDSIDRMIAEQSSK